MTKPIYPAIRRPRLRYRRRGHLQDTVVLELHVPAAMVPWLEHFGHWFGPSVEKAAIFFLTNALSKSQEAMCVNGAYGGRAAYDRIAAAVRRFLAEPVNSGPGAAEAAAVRKHIAEVHGSTRS